MKSRNGWSLKAFRMDQQTEERILEETYVQYHQAFDQK